MKKQKAIPAQQDALAQIRASADNAGTSGSVNHTEQARIKQLIQELQIHQVELETQNEELRLVNEQLEVQQLKLAGIYDLAPVGYYILDASGFIEEVNATGVGLINGDHTPIRYRHFKTLVAPEYSKAYDNFHKEMVTMGTRQSCQLKLITLNKGEFHAQVQGVAVKATLSKHLQYYITVTDITERIAAEALLAETKERLELSLNASQAGVWELNLRSMQMHLDKINHKLCQLNQGDFNNTYLGFIDLIHPDDRSMADQHFRTAINQHEEIDLVCRIAKSDNRLCYASIRGHQVTKPDGSNYITGIMTDVTEKKQREREAALLKLRHQHNITTATLYAEESERKRISEALHDSVSQLLYGIKIQLNQLNTPQTSADVYARINDLLNIAIQETRNISFELAPAVLTDFGLQVAINELAKRLSSQQLHIKTKIKGFVKRLDLLLELSIFRIIQELINNCMKHSQASLIVVEITQNSLIEITVKDNGQGYDVNAAETAPRGAGISSIKNRLSLYNGTLNIKAAPGQGTTVIIKLNNFTQQQTTD